MQRIPSRVNREEAAWISGFDNGDEERGRFGSNIDAIAVDADIHRLRELGALVRVLSC